MATKLGDGTTVTFSGLNSVPAGNEGLDMEDSCPTTDVTPLSSTGARQKMATADDSGSVTLTVFYDPATALPAKGTTATLTITWPDGDTTAGTAILTNRRRGARFGEVMKSVLTWEYSGDLTET